MKRSFLFRAAASSGLLLGASLVLAAPAGERHAPGNTVQLMKRLSEDLQQLERSLAERDAVATQRSLDALASASSSLSAVEPQRNADRAAELESRRERGGALLEEIRALVSEGRFAGARQACDELRESCVACHVDFRADNTARGMFPNRGALLSGELELHDIDGVPRDDRSWVLVFLEARADGPPLDAPEPHLRANPALSQEGRRFEPRVLPVVVGTEVDFPNDDSVFHNVFSLSRTLPFDLGMYEPGDARSVTMVRPGLVKVYCNIHPEMAASVVVLENGLYDLTGPSGSFVIGGVPDGRYTLRAWSDRGVDERVDVELAEGEWARVSLRLTETHRALRHKNKYGKPYKDEY